LQNTTKGKTRDYIPLAFISPPPKVGSARTSRLPTIAFSTAKKQRELAPKREQYKYYCNICTRNEIIRARGLEDEASAISGESARNGDAGVF
jgi:hypothetical protein